MSAKMFPGLQFKYTGIDLIQLIALKAFKHGTQRIETRSVLVISELEHEPVYI